MQLKTTLLAAALTLGLGSTAMAQSFYVGTPFFGVGVGDPAPYAYSYDRYSGDRYNGFDNEGYAPSFGADVYAYSPGPYAYSAPRYRYRGWLQGDRADEHIYSSGGWRALNNAYKDQTGINNN